MIEFSTCLPDKYATFDQFQGLFSPDYTIRKILCGQHEFMIFNSPDFALNNFDFSNRDGDLFIYRDQYLQVSSRGKKDNTIPLRHLN